MSKSRSKARAAALQGLYQRELTGQEVSTIDTDFILSQKVQGLDQAYFQELLNGVSRHQRELDGRLEPFLDRGIAEVDPIECAILRIGAFELLFRSNVPYRVVLNEAIELAKRFGAEHGHRYINGILDKLAHQVRTVEIQSSAVKRRSGSGRQT